jgi:hypothetical protein
MKNRLRNMGLLACLIIMLIAGYAQAKSETEVRGIPQVSVFRQDDGFGIWNLVIRTSEGSTLLCYEDGRNVEVMRNASDLVQSVIEHNNDGKSDVDEDGEIIVIGDYDRRNDLFNLSRVTCLESAQGENDRQELVVDTDYNDKTAALHNRYIIFDEVGTFCNSMAAGVGIPFWGRFRVGNFGINYAWPDPWGAYHYWRRPHVVCSCWDGVFYWKTPHFRRPYWQYHRWKPGYWKRHYRNPWYLIRQPWYRKHRPARDLGYQRGHYTYRKHLGSHHHFPDSRGISIRTKSRSTKYIHGLGFVPKSRSTRYISPFGFRRGR